MLAALVKAGKLPPVEQRLPEHPLVISFPWSTIGKYGGHLTSGCSDTTDWGTGHYIQESMYGHSLLRWQRDGLAIGPGLVESWETNKDQSEWTLHFRKGLKWSDGHPWSTEDILFWWNDEVLEPALKLVPPDEAHSGTGALWKLSAPDATTLVITYDAPTPLTGDRLAMWVKRGIGPRWMDPKHYLMQFHPKYNKKIDPKSNWVDTYTQKWDFTITPGSPTMTGWMLQSYAKGQNTVWTRNPYYWVVDKAGNQLPYIDGITNINVQDPQVFLLKVSQGGVDYLHAAFTSINLSNVSTLKASQKQSKLNITFWDSGDGTGSAWFFNYDYYEPKMRNLIRNPVFRKALSHACDRATIQKVVYFETGEQTTGTMSPKALEFHTQPDGPTIYKQWRDSALTYDPAMASQMLDSIGVKVGPNGKRTMPDGSPLLINLDYPANLAPSSAHLQKDEILVKNWQAINLDTKLNPITPTAVGQEWAQGKLLTNAAWGVGDGPNCLVYPQWLVPLENSRWAPLEGTWNGLIGTGTDKKQLNVDPYKRTPPRMQPDPNGPVEKIYQLYRQTLTQPDQLKRTELVWQIIKVHIQEGPFFSGTVANTPTLELYKTGLKNVPTREDLSPKNGYQYGFTGPWVIPSPAVYEPETYYWEDPSQHQV